MVSDNCNYLRRYSVSCARHNQSENDENNDDESYKKLIEIKFSHSRSPLIKHLIPVRLDCVPFYYENIFWVLIKL